MSNNILGQNETEMDPIINLDPIVPIFDDERRTDDEISLNSENKSKKNLLPIRQASVVWQHYEKIFDDKSILINIKCNYCNQKYSSKSSTTTLNDHWNKKHSKIQPGEVGSIEAAFNNSQHQIHVKLQEEECSDILNNLVNWVITDCQPFRVVDCLSFKEFIASLNSGFQVPS